MEYLLEKSESLVRKTSVEKERFLKKEIQWDNRLIGIKGARGTGRTTLLLQRI